MNCCNEYGKCTLGFNCPVREIPGLGRMTDEDDGTVTLQFIDEVAAQQFMAEYAPSVEVEDMPPMSHYQFMRYFGAFCAGIGFVAACIAAWLYFGG